MSRLEEMISRYRELEQIAINAPDATARKDAMEERINLMILIKKSQAVDASQTIAGIAGTDNQEQFARQDARIKADQAHTKKVDAVLEALAQADNAYSQIPIGETQRRSNAMDRILSLRLQLGRLQTVTEAV